MFWIRKFLMFAVVLLALGLARCENSDSKEPKKTYVSLLEKAIMLFLKTNDAIKHETMSIENDLAQTSESTMDQIINSGNTSIANVFNPFKDKIKLIFPGTYWCGDGDISPNNEDVGLFERTDACCKAHDKCPTSISAQQEKDGLLNNGIFTRSHCDCDGQFYRCLKEAKSLVATNIGTTYFNVLRPQCFDESYPIKNCKKYSKRRLINDKCEEYNYNTTQPKEMEWFDNPDFINIL
ncbi:phospholipase A2-like [Colletes gigas]|uniref:phospholipase A2-like n=1 Tax=Colletes gigas TaxID=935657 RepID=UPI001C9B9A6D|nr:phospholipase A2-like [Colletes gigas]